MGRKRKRQAASDELEHMASGVRRSLAPMKSSAAGDQGMGQSKVVPKNASPAQLGSATPAKSAVAALDDIFAVAKTQKKEKEEAQRKEAAENK